MLTEIQLTTLMSSLEADNIERTESVNKADKFGQAICAFANDLPNHRQPGYLLVGVKDDGTLSGLKVTDELLTSLGAIRSDGNILPQPFMNVAKYSLNGGDVAVVEVFPSDLPPVRYKGRTWIQIRSAILINWKVGQNA
ncbi:helix-turn-helix domain-containing protein [Sulfuritortus calidifontis]|uniref:AlbA family DNA-binding domain-containing protein n=1 Tax=Sulfuritortus calidifontis TaxID=1914471 RepID=UPI000F822A9C|nr:ATP-binding protein [Sulfuritortus calidifontis]